MDNQTLSSILFSNNKNVEFISQLNIVLKQLIDEDRKHTDGSQATPSLWECKWLNGQSGSNGYPKGHAIWMNTNSYQQMVAWHRDTLMSYVTNNSILNNMYKLVDQTDTEAVNQFLLSVANGTASKQVSAVYCLGDISKSVQVRVSKVDDNTHYPTDNNYWKDFYTYTTSAENLTLLNAAAKECIDKAISQHVQQYHLSNLWSIADLDSQGFFKRYPFEVSSVQTQEFYDHEYCNEMKGFDFVKLWKMSSDKTRWCKVWNSGYVEQGGFVYNIPGKALIPVEFMTTYNYPVGAAFYQRDYQTYDTSYAIDNPLQANNRYIVTVTPLLDTAAEHPYPAEPIVVGNEVLYSSVDVTNMSNSGFSIVNTDILAERYSQYSWHACGYKVIEQESQMFDNIKDDEVPLAAFTIEDGVLKAFANANYAQVSIPSNVSAIDNEVFQGQSSIKTFIFYPGLKSIGENAFAGCTMEGISLPNSLESIGDGAFISCKSLAYVNMGSNVDTIGTSAFCNDGKLMNVSRFNDTDPGHTFDMVGDYAFYGTSLKKVNLALRSSSIYTFWGDYCFADCKELEEANILSSCYMSTGMFKGCTKLTSVNFKNNQTSYVYPNVFEGCIALKSIELPSKIWYISEQMFKGCTALQQVTFNSYDKDNSAINLVQKNAFYGCTTLKSVEIPASLTSISQLDDACLSNCALTSISFHGISKEDLIKSSTIQPGQAIGSGMNYTLVDEITKTGMFRLNHSCPIVCKGGDSLQYVYDASKVVAYAAPANYLAYVDNTTTSGFKVANEAFASTSHKYWYYNARQLKTQADSTHVPCLFIWSLLGCDPCQIYMKNIFNNKTFQDWAQKQKFYLCGMEVNKQPYYDTQLEFCRDVLMPGAKNVFSSPQDAESAKYTGQNTNALGNAYYVTTTATGINSNLYTPVLIFYFKKADGTITSFAHTFHNISQQIQMYGVDGVIKLVERLCLYYFDNNSTTSPQYVVDVDKPFDIADYSQDISNPYETAAGSFIVVPASGTSKDNGPLQSIDAVTQDITNRIRALDASYVDISGGDNSIFDSSGNMYLGGCIMQSIPYLYLTFGEQIEYKDPAQMATFLTSGDNAKYKFKVGSRYYKFTIDSSTTKNIPSPCSPSGSYQKAGKVVWVDA